MSKGVIFSSKTIHPLYKKSGNTAIISVSAIFNNAGDRNRTGTGG